MARRRKIDPRELIPETQPRASAPLTPRVLSRFRRFMVPYRSMSGSVYLNIPVAPCNVLRIIAPVLLEVRADNEVIVADDPIRYRTTGTTPDNTFNPEFAAGVGGQVAVTGEAVTLRGGFDITIRRTVHALSLRLLNTPTGGPPNEFSRDELSGAVEVFVGSGAIENMQRGQPMGHVVEFDCTAGAAALRESFAVRPTIHGDDAGRSLAWVPSLSEITGLALAPQWTAAAGVITRVDLFQYGQGAYRLPLWTAYPGTATVDKDFVTPVPYYPWQSRIFVPANDNGALQVRVQASADMDSAECALRMRSWL